METKKVMKVKMSMKNVLTLFTLMCCALIYSCSNEESNSPEVKEFSLATEKVADVNAISNLFGDHSNLTRSDFGAYIDTNEYDMAEIQKITVDGNKVLYLAPQKGNSENFLLGIYDSESSEIACFMRILKQQDGSVTFENEYGEVLADVNYISGLFKVQSYANGDAVVATRAAEGKSTVQKTAGVICGIGIEVICYYSCSAAAITGGWSLFVGCCGAAAAYFVCP